MVDELLLYMGKGTQKIEAIKAYRNLTGAGLKESKDAVERYWVSKDQSI
jgi:ribosomal protein L7/L12